MGGGLNLYAFTGNSPMSGADPSGFCGHDAQLAAFENEDDGWYVNSGKWLDGMFFAHAFSSGGIDWGLGDHLRGGLELAGGTLLIFVFAFAGAGLVGAVPAIARGVVTVGRAAAGLVSGLLGGGGLALRFGGGGAEQEVEDSFPVAYKYMPQWTEAERVAANEKVAGENAAYENGESILTRGANRASAASSQYRSGNGPTPAGMNIDHLHSLQFGGSDTPSNMWWLFESVNKSIGAQGFQLTKHLSGGTIIGPFSISD